MFVILLILLTLSILLILTHYNYLKNKPKYTNTIPIPNIIHKPITNLENILQYENVNSF